MIPLKWGLAQRLVIISILLGLLTIGGKSSLLNKCIYSVYWILEVVYHVKGDEKIVFALF